MGWETLSYLFTAVLGAVAIAVTFYPIPQKPFDWRPLVVGMVLLLGIAAGYSAHRVNLNAVRDAILRQRLLENVVTGGDSFAFIIPEILAPIELTEPGPNSLPALRWIIGNAGEYPLADVKVRMIKESDLLSAFSHNEEYHDQIISFSTIAPGFFDKPPDDDQYLLNPKLEMNREGIAIYDFEIFARNGLVSEVLQIRKGRNSLPWAYRFWVQSTCSIAHETPCSTRVLRSQEKWSDEIEMQPPRKSR